MKHFDRKILALASLVTLSFAPSAGQAQSDSEMFKESVRLYTQGKYSQSAELLNQLVKKNPYKALYWFNLGNTAYMSKSYSKAIQHFEKVITLGGSLAPAAQFYQAKAYQSLGKWDATHDILENLADKKLPPALLAQVKAELQAVQSQGELEEKALEAYQAGNHTEAEALLTKTAEQNLSASGRLLFGLNFIRLSKVNEAEGVLSRLLKLPSLSSEDRSTAQDLLKKVRRRELENKPYWAYADLSHGHTNNVYLDGKSLPATGSSFTKTALGAGYHFDQGKTWSKKIGYSLYYEFAHQAPELKTLTHSLQAPFIYKSKNFDANIAPYVQQQSWNDTTVSRRYGLSLRNTLTRDNSEYGLDVDVASQSSLNDNFIYLSGNGYTVKPYAGVWGATLYGQIYLLAGSDGTQDLSYSDGSLLPLKHSFQGFGTRALWKPSVRWVLSFDASETTRKYASTSLPTNKDRTDKELLLSFKANYTLSPGWSTYILAESLNNDSTLTAADVRDKNFEARVFAIGISWEVF